MTHAKLHLQEAGASHGGSASRRGGTLLLSLLLLACHAPPPQVPAPPLVHTAPPPSEHERYCAWYGEAEDGVLYFGQSPFWSSQRAAGGSPTADLALPGPRPIGRFDLARRRMLPAIETGGGAVTRSGVWDVMPLAGRLYFTTYFEEAGFVDLESGELTLLPHGRSWNELAPGPLVRTPQGFRTRAETQVLVTRYADAQNGGGAVLVLDRDGSMVHELALKAPEDVAYAAKTPAWDPIQREIWVTTDRLPRPASDDESAAFAHPAFVIDLAGRELARFGYAGDTIEIQFVRFTTQGVGYLAVRNGSSLELVVLGPSADRRNLKAALRVPLDDRFEIGFDFAQDIQVGRDGNAFVTTWGGRVYEVSPLAGLVRSWALPRVEDALYYTAVPAPPDGNLCATRCGNVDVVCASPPEHRTR